MSKTFWRALAVGVFFGISTALAGSQSLSDGQRWLTVASTKDFDEAKGIASYYSWKRAKVMQAQAGWYAVVMGPYKATSRKDLARIEPELTDLPGDALFSKGEKYVDTAWEPAPESGGDNGPLTDYSPGKDAEFSNGSMSFKVKMTGDEDNPGPTLITGSDNGKQVFAFQTSTEFSIMASGAGLLKLDPATEQPQLVVTRYSGGAHCCTTTWVVTRPQDAAEWIMLEAKDAADGGGYSYEDVDGDGTVEMLSRDNRFFYAFDSYAASNAPTRITQLHGGKIEDTTTDSKWSHRWRQDLAEMEFSAKLTPEMWTSNGFLVGWLAQKIFLGEGEEAWARMASAYDKTTDFGPSECQIDKPIADCPEEQQRRIPFLRAVAEFLRDADYAPLPNAALAFLK